MAYIDNKETKKLYWTINEVAKMVGVNATTLRYWEDKFPRLRPKVKGPSLVRQYTEADIEYIKKISLEILKRYPEWQWIILGDGIERNNLEQFIA